MTEQEIIDGHLGFEKGDLPLEVRRWRAGGIGRAEPEMSDSRCPSRCEFWDSVPELLWDLSLATMLLVVAPVRFLTCPDPGNMSRSPERFEVITLTGAYCEQ